MNKEQNDLVRPEPSWMEMVKLFRLKFEPQPQLWPEQKEITNGKERYILEEYRIVKV